MSTVMQFLEATFEPLVFAFAVSNLFYMGLQVKMPEVTAAFKQQESHCADLCVGLGAGTGTRLPDHFGSSSGRTLCNPFAPQQSGAGREVRPTDGGKSSRRHGLHGRLNSTGFDWHSGFHAVDGTFDGNGG